MRRTTGLVETMATPVAWRAIVPVMRILVALIAMQLGGVGILVTDLFVGIDEVTEETDCPNEKPGHDCPPGCPGCHCAHGGIAVPPSSLKPATPQTLGEARIVHLRPDEADAPSEPLLPSIFRPPRRASLS